MLSATSQCRLVDASTGLASASRSPKRSYKSSTSRFRLSGGQEILRRVFVAVVVCAAFGTGKLADIQRHSFVNVPASRASFAAGEEPIRNANLFPVPRSLVLQHRTEHAEAGATDVLGQAVVANHATHVQILDCQNIELANQIGCQLAQTILAAVGNVRLMLGDFQLLPPPPITAFYATGENPLQSSQLASVPHRVSRVGDPSPIGQGCQPRDSKIDPDLLARLGECELRWFIQTKAHEISPTSVLGYRDRCWRTCELAAPLDIQATELGNAEILVFGIIVERGNGICCTLFPMLGMELGVLRSLGEKVTESCLQVAQRLLLGNTGRFFQERERRVVPMFSPSLATGVVVNGDSILEAGCSQVQGEIVSMPGAAELFGKLSLLSTSRIDPKCHSLFHLQEYM